jgi:energy-converting hydrogenase Eha subunit A
VTWFKGDQPGDTRPEIIVVTVLAAIIALSAASELVALLLGLRTVPVDDVVDTWEPSVFATLIFVPVQVVFLGLLLLFRRGAGTSTRRLAGWSVGISCVGIVSLLLDHVLVSKGVWGYLKLF